MKALNRWQTRLAVAAAWVALQTSAVQACPNCKFALEAEASPQPRAYMLSIIFMLAVIMSLFGAMSGLLWWLSKQECQTLTDAGYDHVLHNAVTERQGRARPAVLMETRVEPARKRPAGSLLRASSLRIQPAVAT